MRKGFVIGILLLLAGPLFAQQGWCPKPTDRLVNDYSGMLSVKECEILEHRLVVFNDSTSNQILVVITPTLHGEDIMEVGTRIGHTWGVGQEQWDNGLVILIKSKTAEEPDGDVAIVTGYGLEGALPDAFCKRIIDDKMISPLGEGEYYEALTAALDIIEPVCRGEYSYAQYKKSERMSALLGMGVLLLIVVVVVLVLASYEKKHPHKGGGSGFGSGSSGPIFFGGFPTGGRSGGFSGGGFGGFGGFGGGGFGGGGAHGKF